MPSNACDEEEAKKIDKEIYYLANYSGAVPALPVKDKVKNKVRTKEREREHDRDWRDRDHVYDRYVYPTE